MKDIFTLTNIFLFLSNILMFWIGFYLGKKEGEINKELDKE